MNLFQETGNGDGDGNDCGLLPTIPPKSSSGAYRLQSAVDIAGVQDKSEFHHENQPEDLNLKYLQPSPFDRKPGASGVAKYFGQ